MGVARHLTPGINSGVTTSAAPLGLLCSPNKKSFGVGLHLELNRILGWFSINANNPTLKGSHNTAWGIAPGKKAILHPSVYQTTKDSTTNPMGIYRTLNQRIPAINEFMGLPLRICS